MSASLQIECYRGRRTFYGNVNDVRRYSLNRKLLKQQENRRILATMTQRYTQLQLTGALNLQDLKTADQKKQRLKKQSWKMTDQIAGLENVGPGK